MCEYALCTILLCVPNGHLICACFAKNFVRASLTRLDVRVNSLGEEGKAALRKALDGRSGFELLL